MSILQFYCAHAIVTAMLVHTDNRQGSESGWKATPVSAGACSKVAGLHA